MDIFTRKKGLQTFIINGVRKARSKVSPGLFQAGSLVDLVAYFREDKNMHRIKEIHPSTVYSSIPFEIKKGAIVLFLIEICRKTIQTVEENEGLFVFLYNSFIHLDKTKNSVANFHLFFLVQLSEYLGFLPGGSFSKLDCHFDLAEGLFVNTPLDNKSQLLDERHSFLLTQILSGDIYEAHKLICNTSERKELLNQVIIYFRLHVENFNELKSKEILETVFN